jgi:hypothetical protein
MKTLCFSKTIVALAVAVAVTAGYVSLANGQPVPPPVSDSALPANIPPGSALAEVVKLVQSGVDVGIIKNYIANSASAFNLDADKIISLTDVGVPTDLVNAMMEHDKNFSVAPIAPSPAPAPADDQNNSSDNAPPTAPVTVEYFNNTLMPYGSWVEVEGYGRCWRPTTVIYDSTWQPYCDRGHWVYTDCGWYWDSDYSWGATFHYGRWFRHDRFGWCWYPDTVWAPSWVTWRQSDAYCGWAPLPPFAIYRPGFGFSYRGASVAVGFDFGLPVRCFTFVPVGNFYDRHPRSFRAEPRRGEEIFRQTTVINNFNDNHRTVFNGGISVERINAGTHRTIQPVNVGALRNAERQGWRGPVSAADRAERNSSGQQLRHGPVLQDNHNNDANANRRQGAGQPAQPPNRNENSPARPQSPEPPGNRNGQRASDFNNRNSNPSVSSPQNLTPPANNQPAPGTPFVRNQPQRITPPVTGGTPERAQPQNNRPPGGNDRIQSENNFRQQQQSFNQAPVNNVPERSAPPQRSVPQIEQRTPPSAPSAPDRSQQREQRIEQRQNSVVTAPHSVQPPPQNPAPAQSQPPHNSDRSSDKDKQNH